MEELAKLVFETKNGSLNCLDYLLVMTELFEDLGGVLSLTHPDSYHEILKNQFEVAKNGEEAL